MNRNNFIVIFILVVLICTNLYGQADINPKNMVGYGCYYEGKPTKPVDKVSKLINQHQFNKISKLLTSSKSSERYLAAVSLEHLDSLGMYKMDSIEVSKIRLIKKSYDRVSFCSGCTLFVNRQLYELFNSDYILLAKNWLEYELKK